MLITYLIVTLIFYLTSIFLFNIYELDEDTDSKEYLSCRIILLLLSFFWIIIVPFVLVALLLMLVALLCSFLIVTLDNLVSFLIKKFRKK